MEYGYFASGRKDSEAIEASALDLGEALDVERSIYTTSGHTKKPIPWGRNGTDRNAVLPLEGIFFDEVSEVASPHHGSADVLEFLKWQREMSAMWDRNGGCATLYGGSRGGKDILFRIATLDRMEGGSGCARMTDEYLSESVANIILRAQHYYSPQNAPPEMNKYFATVSSMAFRRRPFVTTLGGFGIGPESIEPGDIITVLCGANVPFALRRGEEGQFRVVGEAYCHGIMDGELIAAGLPISDIDLY